MDRRTSIAGIVLIVVGTGLLLARLDLLNFEAGDFLWILAAVGGGMLLYRGFASTGPASGSIFFGTVLLAVSMLRLADSWLSPGLDPGVEGPLYLAAPGLAWVLVVIKSPREWHVLVPAAACLGLALAMYLTEIGSLTRSEVMDTVGSYWPVALLAFGLAMIVTSWRRSEPS